jgi:hypothetical protein
VADSCEHGIESCGFMKDEEFIDWLSKNSAPRSW